MQLWSLVHSLSSRTKAGALVDARVDSYTHVSILCGSAGCRAASWAANMLGERSKAAGMVSDYAFGALRALCDFIAKIPYRAEDVEYKFVVGGGGRMLKKTSLATIGFATVRGNVYTVPFAISLLKCDREMVARQCRIRDVSIACGGLRDSGANW